MSRYRETRRAPSTSGYTLTLDCGHSVDHTDWEGVDPHKLWAPGMGRWCSTHLANRTVTQVITTTAGR